MDIIVGFQTHASLIDQQDDHPFLILPTVSVLAHATVTQGTSYYKCKLQT